MTLVKLDYNAIGGNPVQVVDHLPRLPRLSIDPKFKWITKKGRKEINQWLEEMFGTDEAMDLLGQHIRISEESYKELFCLCEKGEIGYYPSKGKISGR